MLRAADARAHQRFPRLLILILPSPVLIDELDAGLASYLTRMRFMVKDTYVADQVSASLTRLRKEVSASSFPKGESIADQKKLVYSPRRSVKIWY